MSKSIAACTRNVLTTYRFVKESGKIPEGIKKRIEPPERFRVKCKANLQGPMVEIAKIQAGMSADFKKKQAKKKREGH